MASKANKIRIIGGRHGSRRLNFMPVSGLRPTPDRVRETLFNWLQNDIVEARCLDLFAGSGALGLEALSRGASDVVFVEKARVAAQCLSENLVLLREQDSSDVIQYDALRYLAAFEAPPFDVVFLDPPFANKILPKVCELLEQQDCLSANAWIYMEQDAADKWAALPTNWQLYRESNAGQTVQRLIKRE